MNDLDKRLKDSLMAVRDSYADQREEDRVEARTRFIERYRFRRRLWTAGSVVVVGTALVAGLLFTNGRFDLFADRAPDQDLAGKLPKGVISAVVTGSEPVDSGIRLGQVWVANAGDSNVVHVDPSLDRVVAEIPLDGAPQEVDVGQENIWVAGFGRVTAIDPATDEVIGSAQVGEVDDSISVSVGEGFVWAIVDESRLLKVDPATYEAEAVAATTAPVDVAARDGSVWVLDRERGLMRLDPVTTELVTEPAVTFRRRSADISAGGGVVWVASETDDTVIRFTAEGSTPPGTFQVSGTYVDMAVSESIVWVLSRSGDRSILTALDPRTLRALGEPLELVGDPVEVSSGGGDVWVTARAAGAILRIDSASVAR